MGMDIPNGKIESALNWDRKIPASDTPSREYGVIIHIYFKYTYIFVRAI
jgi:hypothetical protein